METLKEVLASPNDLIKYNKINSNTEINIPYIILKGSNIGTNTPDPTNILGGTNIPDITDFDKYGVILSGNFIMNLFYKFDNFTKTICHVYLTKDNLEEILLLFRNNKGFIYSKYSIVVELDNLKVVIHTQIFDSSDALKKIINSQEICDNMFIIDDKIKLTKYTHFMLTYKSLICDEKINIRQNTYHKYFESFNFDIILNNVFPDPIYFTNSYAINYNEYNNTVSNGLAFSYYELNDNIINHVRIFKTNEVEVEVNENLFNLVNNNYDLIEYKSSDIHTECIEFKKIFNCHSLKLDYTLLLNDIKDKRFDMKQIQKYIHHNKIKEVLCSYDDSSKLYDIFNTQWREVSNNIETKKILL